MTRSESFQRWIYDTPARSAADLMATLNSAVVILICGSTHLGLIQMAYLKGSNVRASPDDAGTISVFQLSAPSGETELRAIAGHAASMQHW
jgi:hypothetical protein